MANDFSTDLEASSTQYWSITDAAQTGLDVVGNLTIMMWINRESTGLAGLFDKTSAANVEQYRLQSTGGNLLGFTLEGTGGTYQIESDAAVLNSTATWIHIAVAWDLDGSTATLYVNGSPIAATAEGDISAMTNTDGPVFIGARRITGSAASFFDGLVNDVMFFNNNLGDADVAAYYADPCGWSPPASLVSRWFRTDNGEDEVGSNDLTNNGSATFSTSVAYVCAAGGGGRLPYFNLLGVGT